MRANQRVAVAATAAAVVVPMLAVHWMAESRGLFAQILSLSLWGAAMAAWAGVPGLGRAPWRALRPLLLTLGGVAVGIVLSTLLHPAPAGVWIGSLVVVLAAAGVALAGATATGAAPEAASRALMWGLAVTALVSLVVAALQLGLPGRVSTVWVAPAAVPGRASANLLQPNHLATLLVWAWLAVAAWSARGRDRRPGSAAAAIAPTPPPTVGAFLLAFALQAGVVATASRAGLLASMVIALWAALDRRLPRPTAWLLWITALGALAMTLGRAIITPAASLGTGASLVRPGARGGLLVDALTLVREQPFAGTGWMEFQAAWSLSPLGDRGPRYFEHAHNLVMNLLVEFGVPLGAAICLALIWGALALLRRLKRVTAVWQPRALMLAAMLGVFGLHSLFDAPFLVAYLLLPAAWAWGCLVGLQAGVVPEELQVQPTQFGGPGAAGGGQRPAGSVPGTLAAGGVLLVIAAMTAWSDLRQSLPGADGAAGSRLFGYYADARRARTAPDARPELFRRARWALIDTELLVAWVASLERAGRTDEARYLTQRALEFRDPAFANWLAACRVVPPLEPPGRCLPPGRAFGWQDFR